MPKWWSKVALSATMQAFCVLCLVSCSGKQSIKSNPRFEVESPAEQAAKEISVMPTDFVVPFEESTAAWSRARTFFLQYLGYTKETLAEERRSEKDTFLSNRVAPNGNYLYEISKAVADHGYRFRVACRPRTNAGMRQHLADRNARNVARFIKLGTLERAYLDN